MFLQAEGRTEAASQLTAPDLRREIWDAPRDRRALSDDARDVAGHMAVAEALRASPRRPSCRRVSSLPVLGRELAVVGLYALASASTCTATASGESEGASEFVRGAAGGGGSAAR